MPTKAAKAGPATPQRCPAPLQRQGPPMRTREQTQAANKLRWSGTAAGPQPLQERPTRRDSMTSSNTATWVTRRTSTRRCGRGWPTRPWRWEGTQPRRWPQGRRRCHRTALGSARPPAAWLLPLRLSEQRAREADAASQPLRLPRGPVPVPMLARSLAVPLQRRFGQMALSRPTPPPRLPCQAARVQLRHQCPRWLCRHLPCQLQLPRRRLPLPLGAALPGRRLGAVPRAPTTCISGSQRVPQTSLRPCGTGRRRPWCWVTRPRSWRPRRRQAKS